MIAFRRTLAQAILFSLLALGTIAVGPFIGASYEAAADRVSISSSQGTITVSFAVNTVDPSRFAMTLPNIPIIADYTWSPAEQSQHLASECYSIQRGVLITLFGLNSFTPVAGPATLCR